MRYNREEFQFTKSKIDMKNLKTIREKKGFSQVQLGLLVGVSTSTIESYEQGLRVPSLPTIYHLAEVCGCSIDYLVGRNLELNKYYSLSAKDKEKILSLINNLEKKN